MASTWEKGKLTFETYLCLPVYVIVFILQATCSVSFSLENLAGIANRCCRPDLCMLSCEKVMGQSHFFVTPLHFAREIVQKAALWTEARTVVSGWASSLLWWLIRCWWEHSLEEQVKKQEGRCLKYAISFQERALTVECSIQRWPDTPLWCKKVSKALKIISVSRV